jgi:hypothetical protein
MAKKKHKKNITSLRNQSKTASHVEEAPDDSTAEAVETAPTHTLAPVLEFYVQIRQEFLTPPPLFFDCPARKRKASRDLESDHSESEDETIPNANKGNEEQRPTIEEDMGETENEEAWEEELDETLTPNNELKSRPI